MKINAGIIGAAGYTGGELIRLLLNHEKVQLSFVQSRTHSGKPVYAVHHDLIGETELVFSPTHGFCDVLFLCLPHGESKKWLSENKIVASTRIIDLGNDFRVENTLNEFNFVYGLNEVNEKLIQEAKYVANPGCFATAIQLSLFPLVKAGLLEDVFVTGITGSTGAGASLNESTHFSYRNNNVSAYKTLTHQHLDEINASFKKYCTPNIHFVPWRGNFTRGIFTSSTVVIEKNLNEITNLYKTFYNQKPFVIVSDDAIALKQVINSNKCLLHFEKNKNVVVIHCAIDNLLKGAAGQAVQNMNSMFGIDEQTGLKLKTIAY